jgi:hypothetical protein
VSVWQCCVVLFCVVVLFDGVGAVFVLYSCCYCCDIVRVHVASQYWY